MLHANLNRLKFHMLLGFLTSERVPSNATIGSFCYLAGMLRETNSLEDSLKSMITVHYEWHFGQVLLISVKTFSNKASLSLKGLLRSSKTYNCI